MLPVGIASAASAVNLRASWGDYGAPFEDAARPKLTDGEHVDPMMENLDALAVGITEQWTAEAIQTAHDEVPALPSQEEFEPECSLEQQSRVFFQKKDENNAKPERFQNCATPFWGADTEMIADLQLDYGVVRLVDEEVNRVCEVDMEATGHGTAGELTGPCVAPRQEQ